MKKFYIFCGILCFCFLCVGAYFLVSPLFTSSSASSTQIPNTDIGESSESESEKDEIIFLDTNYSEIILSIDEENAVITYEILPINEIPTVKVEDENILTVENFVIKPHKVGQTKIILSHREISKEIMVTVFQKEVILNFSSEKFYSGKDNNENYIPYIATINFNFNYKNILINFSDNITVIDEKELNNTITITFNILNGSSFVFDITLDNVNVYKEISCQEIQINNDDDENIMPPNPENPDENNPSLDDNQDESDVENYKYEIYYNNLKVDNVLELNLSLPTYIIISFNITNDNGNEQDFTSTINIKDENNITKNSITMGNSNFTILFFERGEITVTLNSEIFNISKTFTILIK